MNNNDDNDIKNDIQSLLKKLHVLEQKIDQFPSFPSNSSGARGKTHTTRSGPSLAQVFSGVKLKKCKSIKKGFITWPSEDEEHAAHTDRVTYVMNRWESHTSNNKNDDLFSEPSDFVDLTGFMDDSRKSSNICSLSIKESNACVVSKIKNSGLQS